MKYRVHYRQEVDAAGLEAPLKKAALITLQTEQVNPGSVTLVLTNETTIQQLNYEFAGIDQPTDVLAFPSSESDPDESGQYYGDVIIALPIAQRQSAHAGHSTEAECALLTVHGTLHLLGYDHGTTEEKEKMWAKQAKILKQLGLAGIELSA